MQGLVELLEDTAMSKEQEEYIEYLREASNRLVRFSETAILITTLRADKYRINYEPLKIKYIIDSILDDFESELAKKKNKSY